MHVFFPFTIFLAFCAGVLMFFTQSLRHTLHHRAHAILNFEISSRYKIENLRARYVVPSRHIPSSTPFSSVLHLSAFSSIVGSECCAIGKFPDRNDLFTILFLAHLQLTLSGQSVIKCCGEYLIRPILFTFIWCVIYMLWCCIFFPICMLAAWCQILTVFLLVPWTAHAEATSEMASVSLLEVFSVISFQEMWLREAKVQVPPGCRVQVPPGCLERKNGARCPPWRRGTATQKQWPGPGGLNASLTENCNHSLTLAPFLLFSGTVSEIVLQFRKAAALHVRFLENKGCPCNL
jgi:hypothetical protein